MNKKLMILVVILIVVLLTLLYLVFFDQNDSDVFKLLSTSVEVKIDDSLELNYELKDSQMSIIWSSLDSNIATIDNSGHVKGINYGSTTITGTVYVNEEKIVRNCLVNVYQGDKNIKLEDIFVPNGELLIKQGTSYQLPLDFNPNNAYVYSINYLFDKDNIVSVNNNTLNALNEGQVNLTMKVNGNVTKIIKVTVTKDDVENGFYDENKKIDLASNYLLLKVGDIINIKDKLLRNDDKDKIAYHSDNSLIASIESNGNLKAFNEGMANITISLGSQKEKVIVKVNPKTGLVNSNGGIWGYTTDKMAIPVRASTSFFENLVNQGMGQINNNIYSYNDNGINYSYDISRSIFKCNGNSVLMRIYYPLNKDLSTLNTFTFLGGIGESNFDGYFSKIDNDPSIIKSSGIVVLVTTIRKEDFFNVDGIIQGTNFLKAIVKQKPKTINSIGGYSKGGGASATAADKGDYQRLLIFNGQFENVYGKTNLMNKDVYIYSVNNDDMKIQTISTLNYIKNSNYKNVTIISNNPEIYNSYYQKFLVVNPGSVMGSGHNSQNITNSNYFMFANS